MGRAGVHVHGLVTVVCMGHIVLATSITKKLVIKQPVLTLGTLVLVHDRHADWCSKSNAELSAGLDNDSILLVSRGGDGALSGTSTGHLGLDIVLGELHARRDAIDNAAD